MIKSCHEELIAPCGMNCGICIGYFGYTMNGAKRKIDCIGCKPKEKSCAHLNYCKKIKKKKVQYCYECTDFPCNNLERIDNIYKKRFDMSMIKNLINIRENGIKHFLQQQIKKYTCPKCGGILCVHNNICYFCTEE